MKKYSSPAINFIKPSPFLQEHHDKAVMLNDSPLAPTLVSTLTYSNDPKLV